MEVMSRVRVRRISQRVRNQLPWVAVNEDGRWLGNFTSWREAMDYADRQARTVEVVLPRIDEHEAYIDGYVGAVESDDGYVIYCCDEAIIIPHMYIKPLALALYSAHVKEKK
ncbi:hypothetical protein CULCOIPH002_06190 [Corynebacterium ulcerans]|nr:hypothetical protein CULTSU28_05080 [Corynebacterium ulcerans]GJJ35707.1 hypothetical protein CULCOIPH002_06190 [Corynebacterium ulcerans]